MMHRWNENSLFKYVSPTPKLLALAVGAILVSFAIGAFEYSINALLNAINAGSKIQFSIIYLLLFIVSIAFFILAFLERRNRSVEKDIYYLVRYRLCASSMGNPLHLRPGEVEPDVSVIRVNNSEFRIRISCRSAKFENLASLESVISDCLRKEHSNFAVVKKSEDISGCYVDYYIKDVAKEYRKQSKYKSLFDVPAYVDTKIHIRDDVVIDYSKVLNSSALIVGSTRSGKTTGIISTFLLPVLKAGSDCYGSKVVIIDPKSAELGRCSYVLSPSLDGSVEHILNEIKTFNQTRIERQQIINQKGLELGKAARWFEIGMKPCILFIDEWVSLQDLFPKKAPKNNPDYSISTFQGLIRQIATQGASVGCFLIVSTAQASVGVGGLDSVVNHSCGIRVLFKPTKEEARFLWDSGQIDSLREGTFGPGDAWFSIDDGQHNNPEFVKFPKFGQHFDEYRALDALLQSYYL